MSWKELCDIRDLQGKELNWFVYIFILELLKKDKKVKQMPVRAEVGPFHSTFILSVYSGHVRWVIAGGLGEILFILIFIFLFIFILSEYSSHVWWVIAGGRGDNVQLFTTAILATIHMGQNKKIILAVTKIPKQHKNQSNVYGECGILCSI